MSGVRLPPFGSVSADRRHVPTTALLCRSRGQRGACGAGWGVIQGDGINVHAMADILDAVLAAGYSAEARLAARQPRRPPAPRPVAANPSPVTHQGRVE